MREKCKNNFRLPEQQAFTLRSICFKTKTTLILPLYNNLYLPVTTPQEINRLLLLLQVLLVDDRDIISDFKFQLRSLWNLYSQVSKLKKKKKSNILGREALKSGCYDCSIVTSWLKLVWSKSHDFFYKDQPQIKQKLATNKQTIKQLSIWR